ncbi:MAG: aspartyl protease family protein [Candidatus Eisenbacteria bacterium]|nr:aspartyl protease family protein [Candidatus Eisenbacteria bacterium]
MPSRIAHALRAGLVAWALASVLPTPMAHADSHRDARALIERYVTLSGGRAALMADTVLHVRGRLQQAGVPGTFEEWRAGSDRWLRHEKQGLLRTRTGHANGEGWKTDFTSKQVSRIEGKDLSALHAELWFESEAWARDTTLTVALGPSSFLAGRSLQGVELSPPNGLRKTVWFDRKTGLPVRVTHRRDQYEWNEDWSGWRTVAGRKRATVRSIGRPEFAAGYQRIDLDSMWAELPRDPQAFAAPGSGKSLATWLGVKDRVELPFRYQRGHVWVKLAIDGHEPAEFVLDTGAFNTCLDRGYAQQIGLNAEGEHVAEGVGGYDTFGFARVQTLRWATPAGKGVELHDLRVGVIELQDALSSVEWGRTAGLLGYDVLGRFTLELDFDRQVLTLHDPATYAHTGGGSALPMTLHGNIPTVDVTLNGKCKGTYIVDVGNASVLSIGAAQVNQCGLMTVKTKQVDHWVGGIGGAFLERVCRLDSLQIGPYRLLQPIAGLTTHHQGGAGSLEIQGNIGTSVLERFRCTFDYANGQLWLEPGTRFATHEAFTRSGLSFTRWAGVVIVFRVVRDSPAEEAGLKVRDVLRAVNGKRIEQWTPEELDRLLQDGPTGSTVRLTYERELREETVELTLADVL